MQNKGTNGTLHTIFKRGSKTYFYNSLFFPASVKNDVFALYSFVRKADDYVDAVPQQEEEFYTFCTRYRRALAGAHTDDVVIDSFVALMRKHTFDPTWIDAFLDAMEMDLTKNQYHHLDEVVAYMYGSAEVVGLMMAKILGVDEKFYDQARLLGRAMQYINFIRDIDEDLNFGRTYFPLDDMDAIGLETLEYEYTKQHPEQFRQFIARQLERYEQWQATAESGFAALPKAARIPIANASDMYKWTAKKIEKDPFIVYRRKIKPSKARIITNIIGKKLFNRDHNGHRRTRSMGDAELVPEN